MNTKQKQKQSTRTSCMRWQGPGYQKSRIQMSPVLMNCNGQRSNQHQRSLNKTPGRVSGDFSKQNLVKISNGEKGKKYLARQCKVCVACKK
jgi:hypothetical protein